MAATKAKTLFPLLFSLVIAAAVLPGSNWLTTTEAARLNTVTAIYVFGDSLADVGNNNFLPGNKAKANFPHFGIDFPGGVSTGRFSNGYNGIDFLAQMLGYKMSPPPVLSIQNWTKQLHGGVNFASGGSGILDITGQNVSLSLNTQIQLFGKVATTLETSMGSKRAKLFLSKALFIFSVGNNDMFGYFIKSGLTNNTAKDQFIGFLTATYNAQLRKLHGLGARKFAVFGTGILGCIPALRAINPTGGCLDDLNDLSLKYDNATVGLLKALGGQLKGMKYSFIDSYRTLTEVLAKPRRFGFKDLQSACCGSGKFNAQSACTPNATYCADRRHYLFWDGTHPTQAASKLTATRAYRGSRLYTTPMNIQQLAQI